jgi:hypothetical protein
MFSLLRMPWQRGQKQHDHRSAGRSSHAPRLERLENRELPSTGHVFAVLAQRPPLQQPPIEWRNYNIHVQDTSQGTAHSDLLIQQQWDTRLRELPPHP